jgi:hypothetical protein
LLIDGLPFLNHDNLRGTLLPNLLDKDKPQRVLFLSGPSCSGKTFAHNLIRVQCRDWDVRYVPIDPVATAADRSSVALAQTIATRLGLEKFTLPEAATSQSKMERRLVDQLGVALALAQEREEQQSLVLLVFDHLDKTMNAQVLQFIEEIVLGTIDGRLQGMRVILVSFPKEPLSEFPKIRRSAEKVTQPGPDVVVSYLGRVALSLELEIDQEEFGEFVSEIYAGHTPPYKEDFMRELPGEVLKIVDGLLLLKSQPT